MWILYNKHKQESYNTYIDIKFHNSDLGGGVVDQALDCEAWGPKFDPWYHVCQSDVLVLFLSYH